LSDGIHEMLSEHNSSTNKVFYYSEKEVFKILKDWETACLIAELSRVNIDLSIWFSNTKKK